MTINIPMLAGAEWVFGVFASIIIVMIVKWFIGILP